MERSAQGFTIADYSRIACSGMNLDQLGTMRGPFILPLIMLLACQGPQEGAAVPAERTDGSTTSPGDLLARHASGLLGEWLHEGTENTWVHEQWRRNGSEGLLGLGFVMSGNDTVFIEELAIQWGDGAPYYAARIPTQNRGEFVRFALAQGLPDSMVFENPGHDFPQRIVYRPDANGGWQVRVHGLQDGVQREERFHFRPRREVSQAS